jgi:hypothetical protein
MIDSRGRSTDEAFEARLTPRWTGALALAWGAAVAAVAWPTLLANLEFYRSFGDPAYFGAIGGLIALAGAVLVHRKVRARIARFEPAALATAALAVCLFKEPAGTLTILAMAASALAVGRFVQRRLGLLTDSPVANVGLSGALGLGFMILAMMALGSAGLIGTAASAALLVAPGLLWRRSLIELWQDTATALRKWPSLSREGAWIPSIAVVSSIVFGSFTLAVALTPTISADGMRYHLPSAIYYAHSGWLLPVPGLTGSHLPQAVELLMTLVYGPGGLPAAQFVNPLFFLLSAPLVYSLTRACGFGREAGVLAVAMGACVPFVHWSGSVVKVDFAVPLFQLASLECFLRGKRQMRVNWLLAGLLFLALSVGAKLTAIYGAIPLVLLHGYLFFRLVSEKVRFKRFQISAFVVLALVIAPFWQYRAYLATHNPWYPFNAGLLVKNIPALTEDRPGPVASYLLYPWITHFRGRMSFEGASDNPAGLFLILFAPVWLLVRRRRSHSSERAYLFFAAAIYIYWGYMWAFLRYGIPLFLVLCALTSGRLSHLLHRGSRPLRGGITAGLIFCLLYSVAVTALYEINLPQLLYLSGRLSKREFLLQANRFYLSLEKLNEIAAPGERTLSIDNDAVLYAPDPALFTYVIRSRKATSAEQASEALIGQLVTGRYEYLIIPTASEENYLQELCVDCRFVSLHRDAYFQLYRVIAPTRAG